MLDSPAELSRRDRAQQPAWLLHGILAAPETGILPSSRTSTRRPEGQKAEERPREADRVPHKAVLRQSGVHTMCWESYL